MRDGVCYSAEPPEGANDFSLNGLRGRCIKAPSDFAGKEREEGVQGGLFVFHTAVVFVFRQQSVSPFFFSSSLQNA